MSWTNGLIIITGAIFTLLLNT